MGPMQSLSNRQIILGISGGIAAYKSAELCRLLVKAGARVRVVMTEAATTFITPLTLQALSGQRVHTALLDAEAEAAMGHIELARWADLVLIAPASANLLARLAEGRADDLLSTLCLATRAPIALAPAMNQAMWQHPQTSAHLQQLQAQGCHIFGPASGSQACGEVGPGRMLEAEQIAQLAAGLFESGALAGCRVLITAGPTREAIDPVRFISNHSSGKMGYALAQAAVDAGAQVSLVSGPVNLPPPPRLSTFIGVESAQQMLEACLAQPADIFIAVAAVADYRPAQVASQKIKKQADSLSLVLEKNPDILAILSLSPSHAEGPRPFCVGFAAETENLAANAKTKLTAKGLDLIFANPASATFNQDQATVQAYWPGGEEDLGQGSKAQLARAMVALIARLHSAYIPSQTVSQSSQD